MTEAQWARTVEELMQLGGWLVYHTRDSRRSAAGFPDYVCLRSHEQLVVELKTDSRSSRVSRDQATWLESFKRAGVETHVWRPSDYEEVASRLTRRLTVVG